MKRFKVEVRDKEKQKVSLALYREESKKIFEILRRYSDQVEKASCDEAFIDITSKVEQLFETTAPPTDQFDWNQAYFLGHKQLNEGSFLPETTYDIKLYLANQIAYEMRSQIDRELGYKASCGISHNKTLAKIASSQNKPNA